jgi:hypothetical protein
VSQGGVLGIGATDLYIPLDAVQTVSPGKSVTLNCAGDACSEQYGRKPSYIQ